MTATAVPPHNRLGLDYRRVPMRKVSCPIMDVHTHAHSVEASRVFVEAARAYGIQQIWTMTPLEEVDAIVEAFPGVFRLIAVPRWQDGGANEKFISDWLRRIDAFWLRGARLFKLHMAPGTRQRWALHFEHPLIERVLQHAYDLGYHFMSHVSDPRAWFAPGRKYADSTVYGTFQDQFPPLERLLARFPDRLHLGAHMGGSLEDLPALAQRLDKFPNYFIDTSATKWITRAVALQDASAVRDFFIRYQDRILFGSDLVIDSKYDFDHYASRYWTHLMQWETPYRGPSPIEDPDAPNGDPQLHGLDLPPEVLEKIYHKNAEKFAARIAHPAD